MARVVTGLCVAPPVRQAKVLESVGPPRILRNDLLDANAQVVASRKVEPHRPAAAAAGIAIALTEGGPPLLLLLPAEAPGIEISEEQASHRCGGARQLV
jgi:hypothetical protein